MRAFLSILFHLPRYLRLSWRLFRDPSVPRHLKWIVAGAMVYAISPLDLNPLPDFTVVGFLEDVVLLVFAVRNLVRLSPPDTVKRHALAIAKKPSPSDNPDSTPQPNA